MYRCNKTFYLYIPVFFRRPLPFDEVLGWSFLRTVLIISGCTSSDHFSSRVSVAAIKDQVFLPRRPKRCVLFVVALVSIDIFVFTIGWSLELSCFLEHKASFFWPYKNLSTAVNGGAAPWTRRRSSMEKMKKNRIVKRRGEHKSKEIV